MAMYNLNAARNVMNELGIPPSDPVAKRIYASLSQSYMSRILNPHDNFDDVYKELRGIVKNGTGDGQWLTTWLATRFEDEKKLWGVEQAAERNARANGQIPVGQYNNFVLSKVLQDQALLAMSYAAEGIDRDKNMKIAHDALRLVQRWPSVDGRGNATEIPLGWDGFEIKVNGAPQRRQSDLPKLMALYRDQLHGVVDW
jgi:hypothetical protein